MFHSERKKSFPSFTFVFIICVCCMGCLFVCLPLSLRPILLALFCLELSALPSVCLSRCQPFIPKNSLPFQMSARLSLLLPYSYLHSVCLPSKLLVFHLCSVFCLCVCRLPAISSGCLSPRVVCLFSKTASLIFSVCLSLLSGCLLVLL
jgi:hypothetical protein